MSKVHGDRNWAIGSAVSRVQREGRHVLYREVTSKGSQAKWQVKAGAGQTPPGYRRAGEVWPNEDGTITVKLEKGRVD